MALSLMRADPDAPTEAREHLARVLDDYDRGHRPRVPRRALMHVQIITFRLVDMDEDGYRAACAEMAPAFAALPGLLAKVWLADPATGTYGGVYLFRDRAAMEAYAASELFATVAAFPHFADIVARDFAVYDDLTRLTQPSVQVVRGAGRRDRLNGRAGEPLGASPGTDDSRSSSPS